MYKLLILSVVTCITSFFCYSQSYKKLKRGDWSANLQLGKDTFLPFHLEIKGSKKAPVFSIHNAEEKIELTSLKAVQDSFQIDFPNFHSYIRFVVKNKKEIIGLWTNLNKGKNYHIPFRATYGLEEIASDLEAKILSGRWKAIFSPDTQDAEYAIGVFKADETYHLSGTFLTETGDYRFLEGKTLYGNQFILSCFDGSHAFLFTGSLTKNGEIDGLFFSGKHYQTKWKATKNETFKLRNADSLTYLINSDIFSFKLKDLEGKDFVFPNEQYKGKPTIIQIMGTWCPNCLDETKFLKEMYDKYHVSGLEIISVGYETPPTFEGKVEKVKLLKDRLDLNFTFLIGGEANKNLASEQFSMLNKVISYPTAIFLNKEGEVVKIHTGFNGPGTGEIYETFKKETEQLIIELLK